MTLARASNLVVLVVALSAAGQRIPERQRVEGRVISDSGKPIEGAVVRLQNLHNRRIRTFVSVDSGRFYFPNLSTATDYDIHATFRGKSSDTKHLSRFRTGAVLTVELTIDLNE